VLLSRVEADEEVMMMPTIFGVWLLHLITASAMLGLIWMVQVVHYPLFERVSREHYVAYHQDHLRKITYIVLPLMGCELASAVAFCVGAHPLMLGHPAWLGSLALLAVVWTSTAVIQIPLHNRLASGFDSLTHHKLVVSNWIRTVAWTLRTVLVGYCGYHWFVEVNLLKA
jgi:hypothetical protein